MDSTTKKSNLNIIIVAVLAVAILAVLIIKKGGDSNSDKPATPAATDQAVTKTAESSSDAKDEAETTPEVAAKKLPRLVDLGATTCIPCKMMEPVLEELRKEYKGKLSVEFYDVHEDPDAGKLYGIRLIPTQIIFDAEGNEVFRHEGFIPKEDILAKFKELGIKLD